MTIELITVTRKWPGYIPCVMSWNYPITLVDTSSTPDTFGITILRAMQRAAEKSTADILMFVHDDVIVHDPLWKDRVLQEFTDPNVGLVGFGGGTQFGSFDLYRKPYELSQLGRGGFLSNMRTAEENGKRFTGSCDVACLDGFVLAIRRNLLERMGGWPLDTPINYYGYDMWLSAMTRRLGFRSRVVGVACDHLGGKTASIVHLQDDHAAAHEYMYKEFRDVLPFEVKG